MQINGSFNSGLTAEDLTLETTDKGVEMVLNEGHTSNSPQTLQKDLPGQSKIDLSTVKEQEKVENVADAVDMQLNKKIHSTGNDILKSVLESFNLSEMEAGSNAEQLNASVTTSIHDDEQLNAPMIDAEPKDKRINLSDPCRADEIAKKTLPVNSKKKTKSEPLEKVTTKISGGKKKREKSSKFTTSKDDLPKCNLTDNDGAYMKTLVSSIGREHHPGKPMDFIETIESQEQFVEHIKQNVLYEDGKLVFTVFST